ncbi:Protein NRT1/ PTR FAMILY 2.7 [Hibiscus syriacus]|uniref:Protein NRT1/ PTR FAMILY 2.7 n=1 Tax=Hibiscus syriacus TaxID=106335 RepID=A0A6A2Y989_HIBSY|nr:Protein NRT1/ PTR FAMILY 2.7 [Hibiscus syriacus]
MVVTADIEAKMSPSMTKNGGFITLFFITGLSLSLSTRVGTNLCVLFGDALSRDGVGSDVVWFRMGIFPVAISSFISTLGIILLTLTAKLSSLGPPPCETGSSLCRTPSKLQYAVLYLSITMASVGLGGSQYTLATMGANQLDMPKDKETFFNWFFFTIFASCIISSTAVVYVEDSLSWALGYAICFAANIVALAVFLAGCRFYRQDEPRGSPFTALLRVLIAAVRKSKVELSSRNEDYYHEQCGTNKDLLKDSNGGWIVKERGKVDIKIIQEWEGGMVVFEEDGIIRFKMWEGKGRSRNMGNMKIDKGLERCLMWKINIYKEIELEEEYRRRSSINRWDDVVKYRDLFWIATGVVLEYNRDLGLSSYDNQEVKRVGLVSVEIELSYERRYFLYRNIWKMMIKLSSHGLRNATCVSVQAADGIGRDRGYSTCYSVQTVGECGRAIVGDGSSRLNRAEQLAEGDGYSVVGAELCLMSKRRSFRRELRQVEDSETCRRVKGWREERGWYSWSVIRRGEFIFLSLVIQLSKFGLVDEIKGSKGESCFFLTIDYYFSLTVEYCSWKMSEEVAELMKHLNFTEEESEDISPPRLATEDDDVEMDKWIVVRIIGYKKVESEAVLRVFRSIWGHARLLDSSILKENMFLFKFKTISDKLAIMKRTPWSFEGMLLAIVHFDPKLSLEEFDFRPLAVWVRIFDLPLGFMKIETAEKIGNRIGKIIATDTRPGDGRMGDFFRVRVEIDSSKPLRRCVKMGVCANGESRKCLLKYERLPSFCHKCGIIGHVFTECPRFSDQLQQFLQFGEWLRVSPIKRPDESSSSRKAGIVYAEGDFNRRTLTSSANFPSPDRGTRTPRGRPWMPGRDLLVSSSANQEDTDPSDPTGTDSSLPRTFPDVFVRCNRELIEELQDYRVESVRAEVGSSSSGKRKIGDASKGKRKVKRINRKVMNILDSTLNSKVGTSEEEDPSELPEEGAGDAQILAEAEYQPRQEPRRYYVGTAGGLGTQRQVATKMGGCFEVERSERCVGLMMLWKEGFEVTLQSFSNIHIDMEVVWKDKKFRFTGFYGRSEWSNKRLNWEMLSHLASISSLPWCVGGDFNEVIHVNEKSGGRNPVRSQMEEFKQCIRVAEARVDTVPMASSDHSAIVLSLEGVAVMRSVRKDYFKFDVCWADEEKCKDIVQRAWGNEDDSFETKVGKLGDTLGGWQRMRRSKAKREEKLLRGAILKIDSGPYNDEKFDLRRNVMAELKDVLDKDEMFWLQRSRVAWLKDGDRNSSFFHARANRRRKKNWIEGLENEGGVWCDRLEDIFGIALRYFSSLFRSSAANPDEEIFQAIEHCIEPCDNEMLCREFSAEEVTFAFSQVNPSKAPGFDGLPGHFFRSFWNIVGSDFVNLCLCLLNGTKEFDFVNRTIVVLISKVDSPKLMKHFRPISLCSVIYKVVSKVIINRLKPLMNACVSENQCAFVPGRSISDNFLVAHEIFHYLKRAKNGPNKGAALKLDMEKAYDRVEWDFLLNVMTRMGFCDSFVNLIRKCISTVSFQIRINGVLSDAFVPQRGLRQGDPLSPYLFLFCAQGLSALLLKAQRRNEIKGIRASVRGPRVSHLFYADDSLLFVKNSLAEVRRIKGILDQYEKASGQKVNYEKSSIYFSPNTPSVDRGSFLRELGVAEASEPGSYLGLPLVVGKGKRAAFNFIKVRTEKRIQGWTKRLLSFGGREVFIKSVVQALPAYAMSCYLIPDGVLEDIKSQARSFWWSGKQNSRVWAMVAWDRICKAKKFGGMGFRDLRMFNLALLGNQIWKFIQDENSLAFKVIKAKYFPNSSFFEARLGANFSYAWASLMKAKEELKDGFFWRVGIDSGIRMFEENWGDACPIEWGERYVDNVARPVRVAEFMIPGCARWDADKVIGVLRTADAEKVLKTLIAPVRGDRILWNHHGSGFYSAKSGYNWLMMRSSPTLVVDGIWNRIARARALPKIRIFGWRICHDAIPVGAKLVQANIGDGLCPLCNLELETIMHAIKDCPKVRSVLVLSGLSQVIVDWSGSSPLSWLVFAHSKLFNEGFDLFLALLWNIWNRRNDMVHNGEMQSDRDVIVRSSSLIEEYHKVTKVDAIVRDEVGFSRYRGWIKPGQDEIKVNVDGAFCKDSRVAAIGVVARDSHGMVIAGLAKKINPPCSAESAEVVAFTEGIKLAFENGWNRVVIEGDAISIVNRLANKRTGKIQDLSTIGLLLNEARLLLVRAPTFKVHYVCRDANRAAHSLVHWALSNTNPICGIFLTTPIAIQSNITVIQALSMDRQLGSRFNIPAASILVVVLISSSIFIALFDRFLFPAWKKLTGRPLTPLQRIRLGHVINVLSMAISAMVQSKRLRTVHDNNLEARPGVIVPMQVWWLFPQLVVGIGDALHFPGQVALYYQEFPASLRSTATAMVSLVVGIAFYISIISKGTLLNWFYFTVSEASMIAIFLAGYRFYRPEQP